MSYYLNYKDEETEALDLKVICSETGQEVSEAG